MDLPTSAWNRTVAVDGGTAISLRKYSELLASPQKLRGIAWSTTMADWQLRQSLISDFSRQPGQRLYGFVGYGYLDTQRAIIELMRGTEVAMAVLSFERIYLRHLVDVVQTQRLTPPE